MINYFIFCGILIVDAYIKDIIIRINESEKYNLVNSVDKAWYVATLITYSLIKS